MKSFLVIAAVVAVGIFAIYQFKGGPGTREPKDDLKAIVTSAKSKDFQVRDALIQLAYHKDENTLKLALERAQNENPKIRGGAAETLGFYETPESTAALTALLGDSDAEVRLH